MPLLLALFLALAAEDPIAGCEVYDKGPDTGLVVQCAGQLMATIVSGPKGSNGPAYLETILTGARSNAPGVEFKPIETVVAGQKRRGYRVVPGKPSPRVGSFLLFETDTDVRVVSCLAPAEIVEARCAAVFERLARGALPAVTHQEIVQQQPYTRLLFRGAPELADGCAFTDGNTIACGHSSVFWAPLKSHDDPKDLIAAMKKAVPAEVKPATSERACEVAGHPAKCEVLTAGTGSVHSFAIIGDVQLEETWYRVECRVNGSIAKGPAPSPCRQLITFTTDVAGDEEPREAKALVFNKSLPAGAILGLDDVSQRLVPASLATTSIVKPSDASYVIHQRLIEPVEEADLVHWAQFAVAMKLSPCGNEPKPLDPRGLSSPFDPHGQSMRKIVVAAHDLEEGRVLTLADLSSRTYRSDMVGRNVADAAAVKKLIGQKAIVPMQAGDPIRLPFLAGYADRATRCRLIREELGNVFDDRGPPPEIAKLSCPAGTAISSGAPPPNGKDGKPSTIGWIYQCLEADGTPHGPFGKWQRRGALIALGAYAHGKRDGLWTTPGAEMHFVAGELDGLKTDFNPDRTNVETASFKRGFREGPQKIVQVDGTAELRFEHGVPKSGWSPGKGKPVMVAVRELHTGDVIAATDLATAMIDGPLRQSLVEQDAVSYVIGQPLLCNIAKGAPIFWVDLDAMK